LVRVFTGLQHGQNDSVFPRLRQASCAPDSVEENKYSSATRRRHLLEEFVCDTVIAGSCGFPQLVDCPVKFCRDEFFV